MHGLQKIKAVFARFALARGRRRPHRVVAVLRPVRDSCEALIKRLVESLLDGAHPFLAPPSTREREASEPADPAVAPATDTLDGLYVRGHGWRRMRRWLFHQAQLPASGGSRDGNWLLEADTVVVCLPHSLLAGASDEARDLELQLGRALGFASEGGKLRRVAMVITDLPPDAGPFHASQVSFTLDGAERLLGFRNGLEARLRASDVQPGEPFADPRLQRFLRSCLDRSDLLARVHDTVARVLRRPSPMFLAGSAPHCPDPAPLLLRWIDGGPQSRGPAVRWATRVAAASLLFGAAFALLAWLFVPSTQAGLTIDDPKFESEIATRLRAYRATRWLGPSAGRVPLERAYLALVGPGELDSVEPDGLAARATSLQKKRQALLRSLIRGLDGDARPQALEEFAARVDADMVWREKWLEELDLKSRQVRAKTLDEELERAAVLAIVAALHLEDGLGPVAADEDLVARMRSHLQTLGQRPLAALAARLMRAQTPAALYEDYISMASEAHQATLAEACPALPRIDLERARGALQASLQHGCRPTTSALALAGEIVAASTFHCPDGTSLLDGETVDEASGVLACQQEALLTIAFRVPGRPSPWHVDVASGACDRFEPAAWRGGASGTGEAATRLKVVPAQHEALCLVFNPHSSVHATREEGLPCGSGSVMRFSLDAPAGTFDFGDETVEWQVENGWPGAGPQFAERESAGEPAGREPEAFLEIEAEYVPQGDLDGRVEYSVTAIRPLTWGEQSPAVPSLYVAAPGTLPAAATQFVVGQRFAFVLEVEQKPSPGKLAWRGRGGIVRLAPPPGGWPVQCRAGAGTLERRVTALFVTDDGGLSSELLVQGHGRWMPLPGKQPEPPQSVQMRFHWQQLDRDSSLTAAVVHEQPPSKKSKKFKNAAKLP